MDSAAEEKQDIKETACLELCAIRILDPEVASKRVFRSSQRKRKMSDSAQAQADHHQAQATASSGAGYNPLLMTGDDQPPPGLGGSVVEDLMSVYESMTQSKSPHHHSNHPQSKPMVQHAHFDATMQNQHYGSPEQHQMQPPQQPPMVQQYSIPEHVYHSQPVPAQLVQYQQMYNGVHTYQQQFPASAQNYAPIDEEEMKPEEVDSDELEDQTRSRRKRKSSSASSSTKGRKKGKNSDGRWSKRFTWPDDLHRDFVSAIFDVGLKHSSPSTIIEHMPKSPDITTERIKSHLQKYRLHRQKSKEEFMSCYETSLNKFQEKGIAGVRTLTNADTAAHLTYVSTLDPSKIAQPPHAPPSQDVATRSGLAYSPHVNEALMLPQLTEAEKKTPIGASMGYLMGLFFSLKQQLAAQRGLANADKMNPMLVHDAAAPRVLPVEDVTRELTTHDSVGSTVGTEETSANPANRNIEVNSQMKRDMQNQMAFQNKMRALKQQQLNKSRGYSDSKEPPAIGQLKDSSQNGDDDAYDGQDAGESGGTDGAQGGAPRSRTMSIGAIGGPDDFWQSDAVDEQLFEFLMNH